MITVELNDNDSQGAHLDYVTFNHRLEKEIRQRSEDGDFGNPRSSVSPSRLATSPTELQPCWSSVCWRCC